MNNTTRVLMLSLMSVAVLAGCKKAVKPEAPADTTTTTPTTPTTPTPPTPEPLTPRQIRSSAKAN